MTGRSRRRRLLRWLIWTVVLVVGLATILLLAINSSPIERRLIALAEERASAALDRPLTIGGLEVGLLPLTVEGRDIVLAGPTAAATPVAQIPRARVHVGLGRLRQSVLELARVEVFEPALLIESSSEGLNLPDFGGGEDGGGGLEVEIGTLSVQNGRMRFAELELPLDLSADGLSLRAIGEGPANLRFHAVADRFVSQLPGAESWPSALRLRGLVTADGVTVDELALDGEDLRVTASGDLLWSGEVPWEADFALDLAGDAGWARRVGYLEDEIAGPWRADGTLKADPAGWNVRAEVASPRLTAAGLSFEELALSLAGDDRGFRFAPLRLRHGEGVVTGEAAIALAEVEELTADLDYSDLAIAELLAPHGIAGFEDSGRLQGELSFRAPLSDVLAGRGATDFRWSGPERLPAAGAGRVTLATGSITVEALEATYGTSALTAVGDYELATANGAFEIFGTTEDAGEWAPWAPNLPWSWSGGRGTVEARLELTAGEASGAANLDFTRLQLAERRVDRLRGELRLVDSATAEVDLVAQAEGGELALRGRVPFSGPGLDLAGRAEGWPLNGTASLIAGAPELGGQLDASVEIAGEVAAPRIVARGEVAALSVAESPFGATRFEVRGGPESWTVERAEISPAAGPVTARGSWRAADGALEGKLEGASLSLEEWPFSLLTAGGDLAGEVAIVARVAGTSSAPQVDLEISSQEVMLGAEALPPATLLSSWRDGVVETSGSLLGLAEIRGGGAASAEALDLRWDLSSERLLDCLRLAAGPGVEGLDGTFAGEASLRGPLDDLAGEIVLDRFSAAFQGREINAVEPIRARWSGDQLRLESFFVEEREGSGELFAAGVVDLAEASLALNVQSSLSAGWLRLALPTLKADGTFSLLATVRGPLASPAINGLGELQQGRLVMAGFPHSFDAVDLRLLFDPGVVILDRLTSEFAGGTARAAGELDLAELLAGNLDYRLQTRMEDVTLRYPEGFVVRGDAALVTTPVAGGGTQVAGTVDLQRAFYLQDVPVSLPKLLRGMLQRDRVEVTEADAVLGSLELAINIRGPEALRIRNNLADLRGDIDLALRGTAAVPVIIGLVDLEPGGTLTQGEVEYGVERGRVTFNSRYEIDPVIDLLAQTEVAGHEVRLAISGTLDKLTTELTSEPALSQVEILSLLATGRRPEGEPFGAGAASSDGVETFLYGQAANLLGERVNSLFGFDRFRVNPVASAEGDSALSFTVGKQISRDLFLTYTSDPSTDLDYRLQVEWQVSDALTVVLSQDGDDTYAVDLRLEHRF
ncbi:MAG: translocation/assembly module TamB domain-containing protein [Acidobacteriota bacterium]